MIASNFNNVQPGLRGDWIEIEGNWVLRPLEGPTTSVVHFLGGAFVGAAPQLTYRLLLESLAARGIMVSSFEYRTTVHNAFQYTLVKLVCLICGMLKRMCGWLQVIATPFSTNFNHLRIADEIHYKWDRCIHNPVIAAEIRNLPVYGLGHSMGSLQHLLISARYASTSRAGNILMSFNNKPATDAIPFFSPFIAPGARALGPFLAQVRLSPLQPLILLRIVVDAGMAHA